MNKDEILAALPTLDRASLEAIQAVTQSLLGGHTGPLAVAAHKLTRSVFDALAAALGLPTPYKTFAATVAAKHLQKRLPELEAFMDKNFEGWGRNLTSQQALLRFMLELLVLDLNSRGVKPSLGIMVNNLGRIPEVFDMEFPGYRRNGMGWMIVKKFL